MNPHIFKMDICIVKYSWIRKYTYTAQPASCIRGFDPVYPLLLAWCEPLTPNWGTFWFSPIWMSWVWYPLIFRGRVRHPLDSKKLFVRYAHMLKECIYTNICILIYSYMYIQVYRDGYQILSKHLRVYIYIYIYVCIYGYTHPCLQVYRYEYIHL